MMAAVGIRRAFPGGAWGGRGPMRLRAIECSTIGARWAAPDPWRGPAASLGTGHGQVNRADWWSLGGRLRAMAGANETAGSPCYAGSARSDE